MLGIVSADNAEGFDLTILILLCAVLARCKGVLRNGDVLTNFSEVVDMTVVCKAVLNCEAEL